MTSNTSYAEIEKLYLHHITISEFRLESDKTELLLLLLL